MAVAHSAASESHTGTTGSTNQTAFSWTHTQTGTPQGVVVFVSTYASTADLISSVTYGGVALTRLTGGLAQDGAGESGRLDTFFLGSGLGAGNQTITVNRTNNATVMYAAAATVTAAADTAVPTATIVLLEGDGTLAAQTVDDTSPGTASVRYAGGYSGLNTPPTAGTGSTLLNSIDIGNYGSALVRETTAGQGARSIGFTGATDDRAAVHLAIRELVPRTETPIVGSFTLTGLGATLAKASPKQMDGGRGAFTFTGNTADLRHNTAITGERGAFTLTGNAADARHNVRIAADQGQFTLAGNDATLAKVAAKELLPVAGVFSLAGNQADLAHGVRIAGDRGAFTFTGQQAGLAHAVKLDGGRGQFLLTGNQAGLTHGYVLAGGAGAFSFVGNPATLTKAAIDQLTPLVGTFAFSGQSVALVRSRLFAADRGQFALTGQSATLRHDWRTTGDRGQFLLTGNQAIFASGRGLLGGTGAFTFTGNPAGLADTDNLGATAGAFILTGLSAALAKSGGTTRRRNVLIF